MSCETFTVLVLEEISELNVILGDCLTAANLAAIYFCEEKSQMSSTAHCIMQDFNMLKRRCTLTEPPLALPVSSVRGVGVVFSLGF